MIIGLPKETKDGERRVALIPQGVAALVEHGQRVRVETSAGLAAGFADNDYAAAGGEIVASASHAFDADLVVKVKEIQPAETPLLRPGGMLFCFLRLAADRQVADAMLAGRVAGIAFETVRGADQRLSILAPMSVLAGELAVVIGAHYLTTPHGGRGVALSDARVVVIGAGSAGLAALCAAAGLGAQPTLLRRPGGREPGQFPEPAARCMTATADHLDAALAGADLVIGAINVPGTATPKLVTRRHLRAMGAGAVLVDVCIDGGGIAETSRPTTHSQPVYREEGVTHYCVTNIPGSVPRSASRLLSAAVLPRVVSIAQKGLARALREDEGLAAGLHIHGGEVMHPAVAAALGRPCRDLDVLLFSC